MKNVLGCSRRLCAGMGALAIWGRGLFWHPPLGPAALWWWENLGAWLSQPGEQSRSLCPTGAPARGTSPGPCFSMASWPAFPSSP